MPFHIREGIFYRLENGFQITLSSALRALKITANESNFII